MLAARITAGMRETSLKERTSLISPVIAFYEFSTTYTKRQALTKILYHLCDQFIWSHFGGALANSQRLSTAHSAPLKFLCLPESAFHRAQHRKNLHC